MPWGGAPRARARRTVAAVLVALSLTACSPGGGTRTLTDDGISLMYPESWRVAGFSTTNSPRRLAVASYPVPEDSVEGDCGGLEAVELLPSDGALVILIDYGTSASFRERPSVLELADGEFAEYECFGPSSMFRFRVGDRNIQAHVALGPDADDALRDQALAILASLSSRSRG